MTGSPAAPATASLHSLRTHDGATVSGVLHRPPNSSTVVSIMHPRQDSTQHPLVREFLDRGYAVWTQNSRSVNNDLTLIHEEALLDVAAGQCFLRDQGFEARLTLGHSGGGALFAYYYEQSGLTPADRENTAPSGRPVDLAGADMPAASGAIFMAPHPGQGRLLERLIDGSVTDEADPTSCNEALDPFDPRNGFAEPPNSSTYSTQFIDTYRRAQRERVARLDEHARTLIAESAAAAREFEESHRTRDKRSSLVTPIMTIYRTDADLRTVDLSLDPNDRPYGSLYGRRPDHSNYGLAGFARLCTAESWLSTWSANTSRADFLRCAPSVSVPTLLIELTGDQACFPADARAMHNAFGTEDKTHVSVPGRHFGTPLKKGMPSGAALAAAEIEQWLAARFPAHSDALAAAN